jgi:hypothetical protein
LYVPSLINLQNAFSKDNNEQTMQDQDILDRNPGLATLITDLNTRFLTPTGTSLHLDQDLHQVNLVPPLLPLTNAPFYFSL